MIPRLKARRFILPLVKKPSLPLFAFPVLFYWNARHGEAEQVAIRSVAFWTAE